MKNEILNPKEWRQYIELRNRQRREDEFSRKHPLISLVVNVAAGLLLAAVVGWFVVALSVM